MGKGLFSRFTGRGKGHNEGPVMPSATAAPVTYPKEIRGFVLAYDYSRVDIYVPWDIFRRVDLNAIAAAPSLALVPEPENTYDAKAVALYWQGDKLGYLYKGRLQDMANRWLKKGFPVFAAFERGRKAYEDSAASISLAFYQPKK